MKKLFLSATFALCAVASAQVATVPELWMYYRMPGDANWTWAKVVPDKAAFTFTPGTYQDSKGNTLPVLTLGVAFPPQQPAQPALPFGVLSVTKTGATSAAVGNCTATTPCSVLIGGKVTQYRDVATITGVANPAALSCTVLIYVDMASGTRNGGYDNTCITSIMGTLTFVPGQKQFPEFSIPLGFCTTAGNAVQDCTSFAGAISREYLDIQPGTITPGTSLVKSYNSSTGKTTLTTAP